MRFAFVLVNDRTPFRQTWCLQCLERIDGSYLREIGTHLPYCDYECYALFREASAERQERARAAS
ncbi:hypothetical protein [Bradyrhizobium iriomotense]|uniref:DUF3330 domain-containing protein n=1 Tax=Bradyrhizobium iriomotense TaxID=441950 RepID=A0ABQ6B1U8_9BRAD|nr:hypothetical protein [Bradyrhizobium iriomotense]GLR88123.1 hypothetical protein GCM10007857_48350 [Bradyrhizobium iriomotense]